MLRKLDTRSWTVGGIVAAVVLAAAAWFLVISPVRSDTDSVRSQTAAANQQNDVARAKLQKLARDRANVGTLTAKLRAALTALPMENGLPEFTRQVYAQAKARGVVLDGVTVGSFTPVTATGAAAPSTTGAADTTTSTTTDTASSGSTAGTTAGTGATASGGVVGIQVTVTSTGNAAAQLAFLRSIQVQGPRRALVTNVAINALATPTSTGSARGACKMTTQLTVFATPKSTQARAELEKLLQLK